MFVPATVALGVVYSLVPSGQPEVRSAEIKGGWAAPPRRCSIEWVTNSRSPGGGELELPGDGWSDRHRRAQRGDQGEHSNAIHRLDLT